MLASKYYTVDTEPVTIDKNHSNAMLSWTLAECYYYYYILVNKYLYTYTDRTLYNISEEFIW